MAISFHTNTPASKAYLGLEKANVLMKKSLSRLSSGQRIASVADDAGGLSVAYKLRSKLDRSIQVVNNLANASSFLDVQQGALDSVGNILSRMSELKTMSLDVTKNSDDIENYDKEFKELQLQLGQISHQKFNGVSLFSDQIPEVLFGDAVGLELLKQTADEDDLNETVNITRWGLRRFLSQNLEAGDKTPSGFGEDPPREFLSMVFTNESLMDTTSSVPSGDGWLRSYHEHSNEDEEAVWQNDNNDWISFLAGNNYSAKIGVITNFSDSIFPDSFDPTGLTAPGYGGAAIEFNPHTFGDGLMLKKDGGTEENPVRKFQKCLFRTNQ